MHWLAECLLTAYVAGLSFPIYCSACDGVALVVPCVIRWEDARRTRMFVRRRSEEAAGENPTAPPALTRWPSADITSRLVVGVLRNRTWKMRRLSRSLACLTAWCRGSPPGPWCSAGWCPTSPSTGTFAGARTQRGSPHTCVWFCWWPTSYGYSLGIK